MGATPPSVDPALRGRLRASGRTLVDASGQPFWGVWGSCLTALAPGRDARALLEQYVSLGFTGVRVFAGALTWAGQTPHGARAALPAFLNLTQEFGLYTEVTINTDTGTGYDVREHTLLVGQILRDFDHAIGEIANEHWHQSQSSAVHSVDYLRELRQLIPFDVCCALSAAQEDELPTPNTDYPTGEGADFITVHLERGIDPWFKEACRVKEQWDISARHNKPVINNEPTKTRNNAEFHFLLGACSRGFGNPVTVYHSESGLQARPLNAVEEECARELVRGYTSLEGNSRFTYNGSHYPVEDADWYEPNQGSTCWRAYGFFSPDGGPSHVVFSGLPGTDFHDANPRWTGGWHPTHTVAVAQQTAVVRVER